MSSTPPKKNGNGTTPPPKDQPSVEMMLQQIGEQARNVEMMQRQTALFSYTETVPEAESYPKEMKVDWDAQDNIGSYTVDKDTGLVTWKPGANLELTSDEHTLPQKISNDIVASEAKIKELQMIWEAGQAAKYQDAEIKLIDDLKARVKEHEKAKIPTKTYVTGNTVTENLYILGVKAKDLESIGFTPESIKPETYKLQDEKDYLADVKVIKTLKDGESMLAERFPEPEEQSKQYKAALNEVDIFIRRIMNTHIKGKKDQLVKLLETPEGKKIIALPAGDPTKDEIALAMADLEWLDTNTSTKANKTLSDLFRFYALRWKSDYFDGTTVSLLKLTADKEAELALHIWESFAIPFTEKSATSRSNVETMFELRSLDKTLTRIVQLLEPQTPKSAKGQNP